MPIRNRVSQAKSQSTIAGHKSENVQPKDWFIERFGTH